MGGRLAAILEPGESVVYHDPRGRIPALGQRWLALVVFLSGLVFLAAWLLDFLHSAAWPVLTVILFGMGVLGWAREAARISATEAAVTERRLIHICGRRKPEDIALALDEIKGIRVRSEGLGSCVVVETRSGAAMELDNLRRPAAFARALAEATGRPAPMTNHGRFLMAEWAIFGCGFLTACGSMALLIKGILASGQEASGLVGTLIMMVLVVAAFAGSLYLGSYLAALLIWRLFSAQELAAWRTQNERE